MRKLPAVRNFKYKLPYSIGYKTFFLFLNNPKNLDPSYKMDLGLWDCLGRVKLITKFHRCCYVICSHSSEGKPPSYSPIYMVFPLRIMPNRKVVKNTQLYISSYRDKHFSLNIDAQRQEGLKALNRSPE